MSHTPSGLTLPHNLRNRQLTQAARTLLIALAVVALLAAAAVLWRITIGAPPHVPATTPAGASVPDGGSCRVGRPC